MRALVVGASGAVGRALAERLERDGHDVTRAARRPHAGGTRVDVQHDLTGFQRLAAAHDVVVNASGVEDPALPRFLAGATLVEISASADYLAALRDEADDAGASVVLGAGLAPGLTTTLVADLDSQAGDDIDVAIMLGSGEHHGPAAVAWTEALAGAPIRSRPEAVAMRNFQERRVLRGGDGRRRGYLRADFPDHTLIGEPTGVSVRSYLALSSRTVTAALALVGALPRLAPLVGAAPAVGDDRWAVAAINRTTGRRSGASGRSQSHATAAFTAVLAEQAHRQGSCGPVTAAQLTTAGELLAALAPER